MREGGQGSDTTKPVSYQVAMATIKRERRGGSGNERVPTPRALGHMGSTDAKGLKGLKQGWGRRA